MYTHTISDQNHLRGRRKKQKKKLPGEAVVVTMEYLEVHLLDRRVSASCLCELALIWRRKFVRIFVCRPSLSGRPAITRIKESFSYQENLSGRKTVLFTLRVSQDHDIDLIHSSIGGGTTRNRSSQLRSPNDFLSQEANHETPPDDGCVSAAVIIHLPPQRSIYRYRSVTRPTGVLAGAANSC